MSALLQASDLAVGYRVARAPSVIVAEHLNLVLHRGELVCLLGPNGAGKSTLLRTMVGMQPPLGGRVTLDGQDITRLTARQWVTRLSVVLTDRPNVGLLNGYALVALGRHPYTDWTGRLTRHDEAVIRWAVEAVGAADVAECPVMELSDGQRQKLMIARALAQESAVMVLDEPTAFLDLPRRAEIMQLLRHLAATTGRAILLSTHDLDLALRAADTLWLMAGRGIQVGAPEDLVLRGAFEAAFRADGVRFDRASGAFSVAVPRGQAVTVVGDGIAQHWTRHALTRTGYRVAEAGDSAMIRIEITNGDGDPCWQLHVDGHTSTHHSIAALIAALTPP